MEAKGGSRGKAAEIANLGGAASNHIDLFALLFSLRLSSCAVSRLDDGDFDLRFVPSLDCQVNPLLYESSREQRTVPCALFQMIA